jgi:IS5 family transposase
VAATPRPTDTVNLTDLDSTLTPTAQQRFIQGYNAQLAVSVGDVGLIVAADVVRDTSDVQQLAPMATQVVSNTGLRPAQLLVDSGYENHPQLQQVEQHYGLEVLCPPSHSARARADSRPRSRWRQACKAKREALRARLRTPEGRALYALRGQTVEPTIGILKSAMGFTRFRLRGLAGVRNEWLLLSLAFNCKRLTAHWR